MGVKIFFVFIKLLTVIGITETVMMGGLYLAGLDPFLQVMIDSLLLPIVAAPLIYLFVIRDIRKEFGSYIAFESLILNLSKRFIDIRSDDVDGEIDDALKNIGEFLKIDTTSLMLFSKNRQDLQEVHQWYSHPTFCTRDAFMEFDFGKFAWFMERLEQNEPIAVDSRAGLPDHAQDELIVMEKLGMKSFLVLPIRRENDLIGFLGFGSYSKHVDWSKRDQALLSMSGEILANLISSREKSASLQKLYMAVEQSADNVIITDVDGKIEYVNSAFEHYTGYTKEEAVGQKPSLIKSDRMPSGYYTELWETISSGKNFSGTVINRRKDGEVYYEEKNITPLIDHHGKITHYVSTGKDVTKQKELENELKRLNTNLQQQVQDEIAKRHKSFLLLENIYRGSILGIVLADTNGTILETNPAFAKMLHYEDDELSGMAFSDITHPDDIGKNRALFNELLDGRLEYYTMEKRYLTKEGDTVWGKLIVRTIKSGSDISYILAMVEDITEKVSITEKNRVQEELMTHQAKMAAMGEMIGAIAHQWRQPLNALSVLLQDIADAYEFGELDKAYLESAVDKSKDQIGFMSRTIDDFRDFFKPSREKTRFGVNQKIDEVVHILQPQIKNSDITITVNASQESDITVYGLANEFKQVVLNILNNAKDALLASKAATPGITITTTVQEEYARITICDNAGGIPDDVMAKIFDPYFTTKGESGTGVGLHIARIIIEEHMDGRLEAANEEAGACFTITLPLG